jgi:hypothetical protein
MLYRATTRTAAMVGGETLSRLDAAATSSNGNIAFLAVTNHYLSALYRTDSGNPALKWATSRRDNIPVNFYVISNNNLRPNSFKTYFQAGSPASLLKKAEGTVTRIALPGMTNPKGHAFTGVSTTASTANGDVAFVATKQFRLRRRWQSLRAKSVDRTRLSRCKAC